jgi:hypothetical protein
MKSAPFFACLLLGLAGFALLGTNVIRAADDEIDAATKARIAEFDKGPAKIDVSAYPPSIQKNYEVFCEKCTLCHTLARPINSDFALPEEWSRYVKRMMHKPGSNITQASAKKIYEFLAYDSSVRKQALLDAKLTPLPAAEKADAAARLKVLHDLFDKK